MGLVKRRVKVHRNPAPLPPPPSPGGPQGTQTSALSPNSCSSSSSAGFAFWMLGKDSGGRGTDGMEGTGRCHGRGRCVPSSGISQTKTRQAQGTESRASSAASEPLGLCPPVLLPELSCPGDLGMFVLGWMGWAGLARVWILVSPLGPFPSSQASLGSSPSVAAVLPLPAVTGHC